MANPNIVIIADYGTCDPAFTEVILQLRSVIPNAYIVPQSTPPFSTLNTGFWIYQIALTPNLKNTYIFSNTAPRKEDKNAQKNNIGEKLMHAKLRNGFEIMAVNARCVLSFVKPYIKEGELAFAPGSSGHDDKFMEIFVRAGNAYRLFDNPNVEEEIIVL